MFTKYLDQFVIGETWVSRGRTITESDLVMFAAFSGDWFPLHTDKEYAANTAFKQRIAHGMLVLSAASGLFQFDPDVVVAFYGMENVRFVNPTFIGDTIHIETKVIDITEKEGGRGVITILQEIKKQNGDIAAVATMKLMINRSPQK
ncbi:MaoC/PaaZ C-terminal domain-containing protein [Effusibacillus dendaii]|uniref:MaoC family dehydratase n=1 Tax=Effusibacillus dendaii TaxID=2743772 RepID=A0A7I8D7N3_9BACL|nr:MaoC/PaaZ C-terminal domain-containing protein [Effusibacillus dendaii]BCJ86114.1 MaoC family dehydratase [Effusibacillus dendaii]